MCFLQVGLTDAFLDFLFSRVFESVSLIWRAEKAKSEFGVEKKEREKRALTNLASPSTRVPNWVLPWPIARR